MRERIGRLSVGLLAALALAACTLAEDDRDEAAERLYGRTWIAQEMFGEPAAEGVESTLVVADNGKVSGNTGCNGYFGSVILDEAAMSFGNLGSTRIACPEPAMGQERRLLRALDRTRGYLVQDGDLLLVDGAGVTLIRFREDAEGSGQHAG